MACGYGRTVIRLLALLCVLFPEVSLAAGPWGTRAVSRALNTSLRGVGREGFGLIWVGRLFVGWWCLKPYSPLLWRWKRAPEFAKATDFCIPVPRRCERQALGFACASVFSAPLIPALCCFFSPTLELEVARRSREVIILLLLTWLASNFGYCRWKPVNWIKATKEVGAVIAPGGRGCESGACSAWGRDGSGGAAAAPGTCRRWQRGTA